MNKKEHQGLDEQGLLDIRQVAKLLSLSERTLYNRVHRKSKNPFPVKAKRIGKRVLFSRKDLDNYIASL